MPCLLPRPTTRAQRALPCACKACPARRQALLALPVAAVLALVNQGPAQAGLLEGVAKQITRPDVFDDVSATVALMDAASVLSEIQDLANTPLDSRERFKARALLPGMAGRLRMVGPSIGALLEAVGKSEDEALSERYGGEGASGSAAETVYKTIGRTITISGRTLRPETLEERSQVATTARKAVLAFVDQLPQKLRNEAQEFRVQRAAAAKS